MTSRKRATRLHPVDPSTMSTTETEKPTPTGVILSISILPLLRIASFSPKVAVDQVGRRLLLPGSHNVSLMNDCCV